MQSCRARFRLLAVMLWASLAAAGCVSSRAFVPAEHVTGLGPGRQLAAEYTVREDNRMVAEVKLWSSGATRNSSDADDDDSTAIKVGFEIQNHTERPVRLDTNRLALEDVNLDDSTLQRVALLRLDGAAEFRPREERAVTAVFRLPDGVWPSEVRGFRVAWTLTNGGRYEQKTPFMWAARHYDDWGPSWYYAPYFYFDVYPGWYWHYRYRPWPGPGWRYRRYPGYP